MEFLIAKASETAPAQTIRIEQAPVSIVPTATPPKKLMDFDNMDQDEAMFGAEIKPKK